MLHTIAIQIKIKEQKKGIALAKKYCVEKITREKNSIISAKAKYSKNVIDMCNCCRKRNVKTTSSPCLVKAI